MTAVGSRTADVGPRTYGGWRTNRGVGIGGLTTGQLMVVATATCIPGVLGAVQLWRVALVLAVPAALVVGLVVARWDGVWLYDVLLARVRWARARRAGSTSYRAGRSGDPRSWQLPGALAPMRLLEEVDTASGQRYGVVWNRRTGVFTATVVVAPTGTTLAHPDEADQWVASWGAWLAALGDEPTVRWVAVTVDTAPDPGSTLTAYVARRRDPEAPAAAQQLLDQLVDASPRASAHVETRVSVTFDPTQESRRPTDLAEALSDVSRRLHGLETALQSCGVTVLGRCTPEQVVALVRVGWDPAARGDVRTALAGDDAGSVLRWADAGPQAAEEAWDHVRSDSGWSVSWGLRDAPRQRVTATVLSRLLAPSQHTRRVTLLYRAEPSQVAAKRLEAEVFGADLRQKLSARTQRTETARDHADRERALRAAREEAEGAGVVNLALYVTTTVTDEADLPLAVADVEHRAAGSKLRLRRLYGGQGAGLVATLPCGVYPPVLATRRGL